MQHIFHEKLLVVAGSIVLLVILIANITASQYIPTMFADIFRSDREPATLVAFIVRAKDLEMYRELASEVQDIAKENDEAIFQRDRALSAQINYYEQLSKAAPPSPQVLYTLYRLYKEKGQNTQAATYLERAQVLDPALKAE